MEYINFLDLGVGY